MKVSKIWHNAKKERPIKSGEYVAITYPYFIQTLSYSKKHDAFNVEDFYDNTENKIAVLYWTTFEELGIKDDEE